MTPRSGGGGCVFCNDSLKTLVIKRMTMREDVNDFLTTAPKEPNGTRDDGGGDDPLCKPFFVPLFLLALPLAHRSKIKESIIIFVCKHFVFI